MRISRETIEAVKNRMDIEEVVREFVPLKKSGINLRGISPFVEEKTPSFFVFPRNQNFKDFSSGKQGDAINFVMEHDGLSYPEAITFLAERYGIEIKTDELDEEQKESYDLRDSLFIVNNFAKDHFKHNLTETTEGRNMGLSYFKERGFSTEIIQKFELGYSLDTWDDLFNSATKAGFKEDLLDKAGLLSKNESGKTFDRFRGRVIFPIHNSTGKTIAFGARILLKEKSPAKYLNSPETDIYHKGKILYGIFQAKKAIRKEDRCYLVEGYTDVISLHQAGVENVVSSSGTALSVDQIRLIGRQTQNITVLFDGDAAGIRAAIRGIDMILAEGLNVRVVMFPNGEDPDSYASKLGPFTFREYLKEQEEDFIRFKIKLLLEEDKGDPIRRADTIKDIIASISKIPDPINRNVYVKESSGLLGIGEDTLYAELNKLQITEKQHSRNKSSEPQPDQIPDNLLAEIAEVTEKIDPTREQERECIRLIVSYGDEPTEGDEKLVKHYIDELEEIEFKTPLYKQIFKIFKEKLYEGEVVGVDYLLAVGDDAIQQEIYSMMSDPYEVSDRWANYKIYVPDESTTLDKTVYMNILRLKYRKVQEMVRENMEVLKNEKDPQKQDELLHVAMKLKEAEMEFAKSLGVVIG